MKQKKDRRSQEEGHGKMPVKVDNMIWRLLGFNPYGCLCYQCNIKARCRKKKELKAWPPEGFIKPKKRVHKKPRRKETIPMPEPKESKGNFIFDGDTKRMHRFLIKSNDGITGSLYIPKDCDGIPEKITLDLKNPNKAGHE